MADARGLHREMLDAVERQDFDRIRELYSSDYEYWGNDGTTGDVEAGIQIARMYTTAFPDLTFEVTHETSCGDVSVLEVIARGTHQGELAGIAPTGAPVEVAVCNIVEIREGKIRREREYFDQLSLMQQLGVIPTET